MMSLHPTVRTQHANGVHTDCDRTTCQYWREFDDAAEREYWAKIMADAHEHG